MKSKAKTCPWERISDFRGFGEFDRFVAWMEQQVAASIAEEVRVGKRYAGTTLFEEKWFRHVASGMTWRLVWPDSPFAGVFEPVE